jgi:uncharacterized protein (TIGR02001 family)
MRKQQHEVGDRTRRLALLAQCMLWPAAAAHAEVRWNGFVGAATEYIYRGLSLSNEQAALQGGVFIRDGAWSAGAWGSTVELSADADRSVEVNLHAARHWRLNSDWTVSAAYSRYEYVRDRLALDYDRDELSASASFRERVTASIAWSPNTTQYDHGVVHGHATAYELSWVQPVGARWSLFGGAGRQDLHDAMDGDYIYWSAGVTFTWASLQIDAVHIAADEAAERLFGPRASRGRWTGALSVRF